MVTDTTPEEEEAWRALCQTKEQTLELASKHTVAELYVCIFCGETHVRLLLASPEQSS